jgi:elongation factor 2
MNGDKKTFVEILTKFNINLLDNETQLEGRKLLSGIYRRWLPAADALLEMIALHLPSPVVAQQHRVETLYTGPFDDEIAKSIRECNSNGPLMIYVSKMIPTTEKGRFYAFGRVFSGAVSQGQRVRVMGTNYISGSRNDVHVTTIQRLVLMMGRKTENLSDCPCGNKIAITGIDEYLVKSGTISTIDNAYPMKAMKFTVAPVVRIAVEPKSPADLMKLVEGLNRLAKSDPCVQVTQDPTGEHIIAGAGELHLEICLKDLQDDFANIPIVRSNPIVPFNETVTSLSRVACLAKSANNLNRLYFQACPLGDELVSATESGEIAQRTEMKTQSTVL